MQIHFRCRSCDEEILQALGSEDLSARCPQCGKAEDLRLSGFVKDGKLDRCPFCHRFQFYVQKDFNRKLGLAIIAVGSVLSFFTYGISLAVCAALDYGIYKLLSDVTVCYYCGTVYRGFARNRDHRPFDLHLAEACDEELRRVQAGQEVKG
ncbi:MAG: hypothetical protein HY652_08075 [Acidobacteria bacterium]|nr:hypothetical protein [Acidobacteriota bacterium]